MSLRFSASLPFFLLASYTLYGQAPQPAPGLRVPGGGLPYALDHFDGKPELVPVHHSTVEVNNHKAANVAGSLAGSFFYKPKMSVEVTGMHARTVLHDLQPAIYIHTMQDTDDGGDTASSETMVFAIVRAIPDKDRRIFAQIRFTQLTGNAKRNDGLVETTTEYLPEGWLKITPQAPLTLGEYALTPIPKAQNTFSTVVFDFAVVPSAPNAPDAIMTKE